MNHTHLRLGINVDHVATVRNARGGTHPDPVRAAVAAIAASADGITVHLREDRRHIIDSDLTRLKAAISAPINLEIAATPEMLAIALLLKPHAVCLVPEKRTEVTTEGGLDVAGQLRTLKPFVATLRNAGIRTSLFVDADMRQLQAACEAGAEIVELHTGAYADAADADARAFEHARLRDAARYTPLLGLECHAGHGLTFGNVGPIAALPEVVELNIGHFLMGEAMLIGLQESITTMRRIINTARTGGVSQQQMSDL
jgi:pyridoxine 5-phosphate synthase